jgi:L-fuculose-phosphate aldolase
MLLEIERLDIVCHAVKLHQAGLTTSTSGNLSVVHREKGLVAISPSGIAHDALRPEDVVIIDGRGQVVSGELRPSSEITLHRALYGARSDIGAIIHTHSIYATAFACLDQEIPAIHYAIAHAGDRVPVAPYALFGTEELARNVAETIGTYNAVLLRNHGLVAVGPTLAAAFTCAEEIEFVARVWFQAKSIGEPVILDAHEVARVRAAFEKYKQRGNRP